MGIKDKVTTQLNKLKHKKSQNNTVDYSAHHAAHPSNANYQSSTYSMVSTFEARPGATNIKNNGSHQSFEAPRSPCHAKSNHFEGPTEANFSAIKVNEFKKNDAHGGEKCEIEKFAMIVEDHGHKPSP